MRLPKLLTRWVDKQIDIAWEDHKHNCAYTDVDPHDVDPLETWRENLHLWFPEAPDWERTIDWVEIWATVWSPTHKRLKLCKIGWHSYTMCYRGHPYYTKCASCQKRDYNYVPRWAR